MDFMTVPNSDEISDIGINPLGSNGRFSNRAARFYWADEEPSPQRAYSIQQLTKSTSADSHFEESPLVIASISAGVIGVAIIIIILVSIWIRSRLFSGGDGSSENPKNVSVRSSTSTLDEEAYVVCMEMDATVLGSMHNVADNECANNATSIVVEPNDFHEESKTSVYVPETTGDAQPSSSSSSAIISPANDDSAATVTETNELK